MKKLILAAAIAAGMAHMTAYALTEVSGDYTIVGSIDYPVVFTDDANLTIAANATTYLGVVTNDGHTVTINLESGCATQISWLESLNGATTKINFKGGRFTDAGGWGTYWFKQGTGCKVELASVDGNPIWITQPNYQYKWFRSGDGLFTSGTGRFYVQTPFLSGTTRIFFGANLPTTNYLHTGGTCISGVSDHSAAWFDFTDSNQFPPGRVEIGRAANTGGAWINMNGTAQTAEELVRLGTFGGVTKTLPARRARSRSARPVRCWTVRCMAR